jgi:cold shock CspA family protein
MAKSQQSFSKSEKEKKRLKKRQDKLSKKEVRRANSDGGDFQNMIAYVDENGQISDTPPDPSKKTKITASTIEIGVPKKTDKEVPNELQGKVSYFDDSKGFGFIIDSQTQEKYFVHVSGLLDEVKENDKVSFELQRGLKGMNAIKVKKI